MLKFASVRFSKGKGPVMDLVKQTQIIESIHQTLNDYVGKRLRVRANMGRAKIVENEGTLTQVHPQLFIMEIDRKRGRTSRQSFQYVDILTGTVELFCGDESIFEPFVFEEEQPEVAVTPLMDLFADED